MTSLFNIAFGYFINILDSKIELPLQKLGICKLLVEHNLHYTLTASSTSTCQCWLVIIPFPNFTNNRRNSVSNIVCPILVLREHNYWINCPPTLSFTSCQPKGILWSLIRRILPIYSNHLFKLKPPIYFEFTRTQHKHW